MKKIRLNLVVTTIVLSGVLSANSYAQAIDIGGGLVLGTDRPNLGLKVQGNYGMDFLLEHLSSSVAFTFFIPASPTNTKFNRWSLDFDSHYNFFEMSSFEFYAIGGINISHYKTESTTFGVTNSKSGTRPGLNVGTGAFYKFNEKMKGFSEFKYILSNYDQAEISFGILFEL